VGAINPGITSSNWVIENVVESWGNWAGILLHGWGHLVKDSITDDNGDDGIEGTLCQYVTLDGNISRSNDWQRDRIINPDWGSGGSKFTQVDHMLVRNHEAAFNHGPGIWFDENNKDITIENSRFHHNMSGIMAEISTGPFNFLNNICFANEGAGILIAESANVMIENNTLVANKYGIDLRNISGRKGAGLTEAQGSFKVANVSIRRNIIAQNEAAGIINSFSPIGIVENRVKSDSNLFFKNSAIVIWPVKQGTGATTKIDASNDWAPPENGGGVRLLSLEAVHKAVGLETNSVVADPHFVMPEINDYSVDPYAAGSFRAGASFPSNALEKQR
jgi:parallel beta-helix repeat protein